ncbi:MAG: hypothetical protein AAF802_07140 [Planctomycetota bacterium]
MGTCLSDGAEAIDIVAETRFDRLVASPLADLLSAEQLCRLGEVVPSGVRFRAVMCSHLGHSAERQALIARYVCRSVLEAKHSCETLLVAAGTAIEPWVLRAANLFDVPVAVLAAQSIGGSCRAGCSRSHQQAYSMEFDGLTEANRDPLIALLADRVDCVFVRSRGRVFHSIRQRLLADDQPSTRLAVHPSLAKETGRSLRSLMDLGAVGWYCHLPRDRSVTSESPFVRCAEDSASTDQVWMRSSDEWLIHCTRQFSGPWPGQSHENYRDELLLGETSLVERSRSPLGSLHRILRMRRLTGSSIVSCSDFPVVCFSESSLVDVLARRTFRRHLHRWDCEPYGIAIRKSAAIKAGLKSVIYGTSRAAVSLAKADAYRFQARGKTFDWTQENEWRSNGDVNLESFSPSDIRVFVNFPSEVDMLPASYSTTAVES